MEVINQYGEFTKTEIFNLTRNAGELLKNVPDDTIIPVDRAIIIRDVVKGKANEDGSPKTKDILHIYTKDGHIYSTESPTVLDTFTTAVSFMETEELEFKLKRQTSKNGRVFMDIELL